MRGRTDLGDRTGRAVHGVRPHRLDRVDHHDVRGLGLERGKDVAQARLGRQQHRRLGQAQSLGAQADLRTRLLAGDINGLEPGAPEARRRLQQQRRLPDPRVAPDKDRRGCDKSATQNPVELRDATRHPRGRAFVGCQRSEGHARASRDQRLLSRPRRERRLFHDGVPFPTGVTASRPLGVGRAAGDAREACRLAHGGIYPARARPRKRWVSRSGRREVRKTGSKAGAR